jgi:hypothetical protein
VVALDNSQVLPAPPRLHFSLPLFSATACALLALIPMAMHGFDENGLRLGSDIAWRFTSFVFFVALVAGPLGHLLPFAPMQMLGSRQRQLLWGFCASFFVYLASLLVPNTIRPVSLPHEGLTPGMAVFVLFSAMVVAVIAYSVTRHAKAVLGDAARRAILTIGIAYFWLAYALTGLSRISGPHRPEIYYSLSLSLMVLALLVRFADCFVRKLRMRVSEPGPASVR